MKSIRQMWNEHSSDLPIANMSHVEYMALEGSFYAGFANSLMAICEVSDQDEREGRKTVEKWQKELDQFLEENSIKLKEKRNAT